MHLCKIATGSIASVRLATVGVKCRCRGKSGITRNVGGWFLFSSERKLRGSVKVGNDDGSTDSTVAAGQV